HSDGRDFDAGASQLPINHLALKLSGCGSPRQAPDAAIASVSARLGSFVRNGICRHRSSYTDSDSSEKCTPSHIIAFLYFWSFVTGHRPPYYHAVYPHLDSITRLIETS